jgi:uncharacterized protein YcbK (DUF882 family)
MPTDRLFLSYPEKKTIVFLIVITFLSLALTVPSGSPQAAYGPEPFFLMGSGKLHLKNLRNTKEARVELLNLDGSLNDAAFIEVDRVFGFPTEEKGEHISPRLLFMLSYFADLVAPGKMIVIESGYRSSDYNDKIRKKVANVAKTSTHIDGLALDFWIDGIDGKKLWETVREKNCCGVGHYGGKTIHLDAGRPRFWEAATSGTKSKEPDYNRHLYLSTDFDRYAPGAKVRLSLSGIGTFGFGVKTTARLYGSADTERPITQMQIASGNKSDCLILGDHKASRFLYATVPAELPISHHKAGRYKIKLDFCQKPFEQMPTEVYSNEIELVTPAGFPGKSP